MKKTIALGLALALTSALPATAATATHTVYNTTDKCIWVTVDTSNMISPWRNDAAHNVMPHGSFPFTVESRPELKVRAQPHRNANCTGGTYADVDNVTKASIVDIKKMNFTIIENAGRFHVRYGTP